MKARVRMYTDGFDEERVDNLGIDHEDAIEGYEFHFVARDVTQMTVMTNEQNQPYELVLTFNTGLSRAIEYDEYVYQQLSILLNVL